eukprot:6208190-Pleurochrysis_carterae.AAC.1
MLFEAACSDVLSMLFHESPRGADDGHALGVRADRVPTDLKRATISATRTLKPRTALRWVRTALRWGTSVVASCVWLQVRHGV